MGLTIHYNLMAIKSDAAEAERLVRALHACAQTQGFDKVSPVFHETEADEHEDGFGAMYPGRRFLDTGREPTPGREDPPAFEPMSDEQVEAEAQAIVEMFDEKLKRRQLGLPDEDDDEPSFGAELIDATDGRVLDVHPLECWFFWANAEGAEPLIVGLGRYPSVIEHEVNGEPERFETGLGVGWHWEGLCKTQYAGMPAAGGPEHFLHVHKAVVGVLDHAVALDLGVEVHDEGGYWSDRDEAALSEKLRMWNAMIASVAGRLKDSGRSVEAPILEHPAFEHLEAEGEAAIKRFREQRGTDSDQD